MKSFCIYRSRSDPLVVAWVFALLLVAFPTVALAQHNPAGSDPTTIIVRTATQAALADNVPEENQEATPVTAPPPAAPPEGFWPEPRFIRRGINFATRTVGDGGNATNGFFPEFSNMPTGSGWISAGPGYRQWLFSDKAFVEGSAAVSWRMYKMAQARFEFTKLAHDRLSVGSQVLWQDLTQVTYFGIGSETEDNDRSEYRMKTTNVVGYAIVRPLKWLSIGTRGGWLKRPTLFSPGGSFKRGNPDTQTVFADDVVFTLADQPNYLHGEASVVADTRDSRSHPSSGGVYRAMAAMYSDRSAGMFTFRRYEAEAAHFVPLADRRIVIAAHGWFVGTETRADETVPFYLMPGLGGSTTIRSFTDFRFHDRNLLVMNAEARFAVFTHVDVAGFVDAGNVAPRVSGLDLGKRAYGVGVRMHTSRATFLRLDVAHGVDGWRLVFRTNDPLHLSRLSRRTAAVPFVP